MPNCGKSPCCAHPWPSLPLIPGCHIKWCWETVSWVRPGSAYCMYDDSQQTANPEPPPAATLTPVCTPLEKAAYVVEGERSYWLAAPPPSGCPHVKRPLGPVHDGKQPSACFFTTGVLLGPDVHSCQSEAECLHACVQHWPHNGCTGRDSPSAADSSLLQSGFSQDSAQPCTSVIVIDDGLVCPEPADLPEVGPGHDILCTNGQAAAAVPAPTPQPHCAHNCVELNALAAICGDNPSSTDCPTAVNQATRDVTSSVSGSPSTVVAPLSLVQPRSSYADIVRFGATGPPSAK